MDWKIFFACFGTIFLAELGDKTQLATLMYSTQAKNPWLIFAAAAMALTLTSFIAVIVGQGAAKLLPEQLVKTVAGAAFIVIGAIILFGVWRGQGA